MQTTSRVRRITVGVFVAFVAVVTALHLPPFRRWFASVAGCPFPSGRPEITATEAEALRVATFAMPGAAPVEACAQMPAFGFRFGASTRAEVVAWAAQNGQRCESDRSGASLRCVDASGAVLPEPLAGAPHGQLGFGFDAAERLVSVQLVARDTDRARAEGWARDAEARLARCEADGGPRITRSGDALERELAQRRAVLARPDFRGDVTATRVGGAIVVVQSFQTLPPGDAAL